MTLPIIIVHLCAFAFAASLAVSGFMRAFHITDTPNARSSHSAPTPSAGGVGIVFGVFAAMIALYLFYPGLFNEPFLPVLGALALATASLGLVDDIKALPPLVKGLGLVLISLATPLLTGVPQGLPLGVISWSFPYWLAYVGAVLWVFVVMNLVNFMDGANGLMGAVMMVASGGLAVVSLMMNVYDAAIISAALSAAVTGFLVYNFRGKASIFCGDVGALFIGFVFATCVLRLCAHPHGSGLLFAGPLLILPILTDGLLTLLVRARHKAPLLSAHNTHLYQRMIQAGRSHVSTALIYMAYAMACALWVVFASATGLIASASLFMLVVFMGAFIYARTLRLITEAQR